MLAFQADGPGSIDAQWFMIHNSSENFGIPPVSRCFASEYPGERMCCKLFFTSPPIGMVARKETVWSKERFVECFEMLSCILQEYVLSEIVDCDI